ncbi:MAG: ribosomal protein S18-alanine N-acetyltransferase [Candidatus Binatia bacterium]|nr:ribosomal protein S18-alanine N-acetyltransferase [Candidatus Binatia bacterium]
MIATGATLAPLIRSFELADLSAVLSIEQASSPCPWKAEFFLSELHKPYARVFIAELQGEVIGYLCCWFVVDEVQILNLAVHPSYRRHGVAKALLQAVLTAARGAGMRYLSLEVRRGNRPARALYHQFHFRQVAVRPRYYADGEDALLLVCDLSQT